MMNFAGYATQKNKQLLCDGDSTATMLDNILVYEQDSAPPYKIFLDKTCSMQSIYEPLVRFVSLQTHLTK